MYELFLQYKHGVCFFVLKNEKYSLLYRFSMLHPRLSLAMGAERSSTPVSPLQRLKMNALSRLSSRRSADTGSISGSVRNVGGYVWLFASWYTAQYDWGKWRFSNTTGVCQGSLLSILVAQVLSRRREIWLLRHPKFHRNHIHAMYFVTIFVAT